ncbi:response regulator [Marilutibacter chinensis]|uniref:Response regulator n=1 Tax=Marilutibacter chinensis TaxID=2912247 RepID=A0ABS9HZZ5_9GAMM|nr:response regulator [Lysobacter chinensis]MCF7223699.1 response regulator [Lysobacter chinensis]
MFFRIGKPTPLKDMAQSLHLHGSGREGQKILVVDDQPFVLKEILASHGFSITYTKDIQSTSLTASYPIIICDIKGVGAHLGGKHEGAHLFREIRRAYPEKYIIAFTGYRYDPTYNEYFKYADISLKKDTDSEAWVNVLDNAVGVMADPTRRWLRLRQYLLEHANMELWDVLMLEQGFISSIQQRNESKILNSMVDIQVSPQTSELIKAFATAIFTDILSNGVSSVL